MQKLIARERSAPSRGTRHRGEGDAIKLGDVYDEPRQEDCRGGAPAGRSSPPAGHAGVDLDQSRVGLRAAHDAEAQEPAARDIVDEPARADEQPPADRLEPAGLRGPGVAP